MAYELSQPELRRLTEAVEYSRRQLNPYRRRRLQAIRKYVGYHYSDDGSRNNRPLNLLELYVSVHVRQLAPKPPSALVTTPHKWLKPAARSLELDLNLLMKEINLGRTLRRLVMDALFGIGIAKIAQESVGTVEIEGEEYEAPGPFVSVVSLEDWVHDTEAWTWDAATFMGNRYRLPLSEVQADDSLDAKAVKALKASHRRILEEEGQESSRNISRGDDNEPDEFQDHVELIDLFLPRKGCVVTLPFDLRVDWQDQQRVRPLRTLRWEGPESGPFKILSYGDVPDQLMPLPPVANMIDLDEMANTLIRKLRFQAVNRKTVIPYQNDEDAQAVKEAEDLQTVKMNNPAGLGSLTVGGVDQASLAFLIAVKDWFSYGAGNMDAIGGLGVQADTATQEQIVSAASSRKLAEMTDRTVEFTREIVHDLGWYLYRDPVRERTLSKPVAGTDLSIPSRVGPTERQRGQWLDYHFDIDPYSMQHPSPAQRVQAIMQTIQTVASMAPLAEAQGVSIDFPALMRMLGKYTGIPNELEELLTFVEPREAPAESERRASKPAFSERTYTRRNVPGASRSGKDEAMIGMLMGGGGGVQPAQRASVARSTG